MKKGKCLTAEDRKIQLSLMSKKEFVFELLKIL